MNIPDKFTFTKPQTATLVTRETQTQLIKGYNFTQAGVTFTIDNNAQTVTANLPGLNRPKMLIMGGGAATPFKDGHTEQDRRAAVFKALGIDPAAIAPAATT